MSNIFLISFYVLIGVVVIVVFVPAVYSLVSRSKQSAKPAAVEHAQVPPQFTVVNNEPVYASSINSDSTVQTSRPQQQGRETGVHQPKPQQTTAAQPKPAKFSVMNPGDLSNDQQQQPSIRNWKSHWQ